MTLFPVELGSGFRSPLLTGSWKSWPLLEERRPTYSHLVKYLVFSFHFGALKTLLINYTILWFFVTLLELKRDLINSRLTGAVSGYEFFKSRNIICMNYVKSFYPQWLAQCIVQSWCLFIHSFHKMLNAFICVRNYFRKQRTVNKQHTSL